MNPSTDDPHNILDSLNQLLFVGLGLGAVIALVAVALGAVGALAYTVVTTF